MSKPGLFSLKLPVLFLFSVGFLLFITVNPVNAQLPAEDKFSFHIHNESLRSVLIRFSDTYSVNLTYNASDPVFDQKISYSDQDITIAEALTAILKTIHHEIEHVGNHFVIIKSKETESRVGVANLPKKNKNEDIHPVNIQALPDDVIKTPVILVDTVILIDTVIQIRELLVRDTVYIERQPEREVTRSQRLLRDILGIEITQRDRWALGISYMQMLTDHRLVSNQTLTPDMQPVMDAEALSFRNFGLGVSLQYNIEGFSLVGNLGLNRFAHRFSYNELFTTGGFNLIDTLDSFFTIFQNDTLWTHITDTTWVPLESREILYDRMNRYVFLETGISASYVFYGGRSFSFYGNAGFIVSTPLWYRAQTITNADGYPPADVTGENITPWLFAWSAGMGVRLRLSTISDLFLESNFRSYLNDWNRDHPLDRRINGLAIRAGLIYYF
jgi:hypothetical protein